MHPIATAVITAGGLLLGVLILLDIGFRIGRGQGVDPELSHQGIGAMEGAVFGLLGLLLGFSFGGGTSRMEYRRQLIIQEGNAIGTAYMRLDTLPPAAQPAVRTLFREYLDARIHVYENLHDAQSVEPNLKLVDQLQKKLWSSVLAAGQTDPTNTSPRLLIPAINQMIEITTARTVALRTNLPALIFWLLIAISLLSGLLAGFAMSKRRTRSWLHMVVYATVISITVYTVLDLDNPRFGLIRLETADQVLTDLQRSIRE